MTKALFALLFTGHTTTAAPRYPDMKEAQAALAEALKEELKEAQRHGWTNARIHRSKKSGEVLASHDKRSPLWMGIAIVSV